MKDTKYIWLKQGLDYYEKNAIDWLCGLPNGGNYVVLYQRLCILAVKNGENCILRHVTKNQYNAYTLADLARAIKYDVNIVTAGIPILLSLNLIQMRADGAYVIPGLEKMVGSDSERVKQQKISKAKQEHMRKLARLRQRKCRANKKLKALSSGQEAPKQLTAPIPNGLNPDILVPNVPTQVQVENNPYAGYGGTIPVEVLPPGFPITPGVKPTKQKK